MWRGMRVGAIAACALVLCSACDRRDGDSGGQAAEMGVLRLEVQQLRTDLKALSDRVSEHWIQAATERSSRPSDSVEFDPRESAGYGRFSSNVGTMLARMDKIEPYLDGYTITFSIGNPSTVRLVGAEGLVKWGRDLDFNDPKTLNLQEKTFKVLSEFQPGSWTSFKVSIAPASPEQIRRIVLAPKFNTVSLRSANGIAQ